MNLSDIVIILNRTSEAGNVGAVCRAMKNSGLSRLRLVSPGPLNEEALLARAIHAEDVWRDARFFDTLIEAVADCPLVVGTTCRRGKKRKTTMPPRTLTAWLKDRQSATTSASVALVFGNERTGLTEEELNLCNIASHIPVSDSFPSFNLSHAVQIYAYEMFMAFGNNDSGPARVKGEWNPLSRKAADELTAEITTALADLGFYKISGREEQTRFLLDMICRAGLTEKEGRYLKHIFTKAAWLGNR